MPLPLAPLIMAGSALGGNVINAASVASQNKKSRKWNEKMYSIQRQDALADWNMQNEYNTPAMQMKRLKEAGLNPNLVYGNGADVTANSAPRSSSVESWRPEAFKPDLSMVADSIFASVDLATKKATLDNIEAQGAVLEQEALLKSMQVQNSSTDNLTKQYNLRREDELKDISFERARLGVKKLESDISNVQARTQFTIHEDERQAVKNVQDLQKGLEIILSMRLQRAKTKEEIENLKQIRENLKNSAELQKLEINLKKKGFSWSDPYYIRIAGQLLGGQSVKDVLKSTDDALREGVEGIKANPSSLGWFIPGIGPILRNR